MNSIQAIKDGAASATRIPAPLVITFVVYWVVALALTVPVAAGMNAWVGHRLTARDLARDFDGMLLLEPMVSASAVLQADTPPSADAMAASRAAATTLFSMLPMALAAMLAAPLLTSVVGGGVLLTYVEGRFAWRRFLWGAWHWLLPFFLLAILFGVCATIVVALGVIALAIIQAVEVRVLMLPALAVTGLAYVVMAMTFEYARVIAVADHTRNFFQALGRAAVMIARQPMRTCSVYALTSAVGLALIPLYVNILAPIIPFEWALVAISAQQLYILARLWARLARWAGEATLYRQMLAG